MIQNILNIRFVHATQSGLWWNKKSGNTFVYHCRIKRGIPVYKTVKQALKIIKIGVTTSCIFFQSELESIFVYIFVYQQNSKYDADEKSCLVRKLHFWLSFDFREIMPDYIQEQQNKISTKQLFSVYNNQEFTTFFSSVRVWRMIGWVLQVTWFICK